MPFDLKNPGPLVDSHGIEVGQNGSVVSDEDVCMLKVAVRDMMPAQFFEQLPQLFGQTRPLLPAFRVVSYKMLKPLPFDVFGYQIGLPDNRPFAVLDVGERPRRWYTEFPEPVPMQPAPPGA